jgi:hypothetical protein
MIPRAASLAIVVACAAACGGASGGTRTSDLVIAPTIGKPPIIATTALEPVRAPHPNDDIIRGVGGVEVGQTIAELRRRLGEELRSDSLEKERAAFKTFGYDVARNVPFILGFDEVLVFNDDTIRSEPPIWKVYVKDGIAVMLKITTVGFEEHLKEHRIGFAPTCFLLDPPTGIFATFGNVFLQEDLSDHVTYHFVDRGLSVLVFSDAIRVFDIFGDVGDEGRAKIRAALAQPKP